MKKTIIMLQILLLTSVFALCQSLSFELVSSSGDQFINSSYELEWSIGEIQTESYSQTSQILTQGFHQNTYIITTIEQSSELKFDVLAYPNPTSDFVNLKIQDSKVDNLQYTLTDINGKVLQINNFSSSNQQIDFSKFAIGSYFILVSQNKHLIKSFKIVKN